MDPELWAQILQMVGSTPPEMDKYGNVQPYDLTVASKGLNYNQDLLGMLSNPLYALLAGDGAFDPTSFLGGAAAAVPQTPMLDTYLQSQDPVVSTIASSIAAGETPEAIRAQQRAEGIPEDQVKENYDLASSLFKERVTASSDPTKQSPMQQFAAKAGLPNPLEQYGSDRFMSDEQRRQATARDVADRTSRAAVERLWAKYLDMPGATSRDGRVTVTPDMPQSVNPNYNPAGTPLPTAQVPQAGFSSMELGQNPNNMTLDQLESFKGRNEADARRRAVAKEYGYRTDPQSTPEWKKKKAVAGQLSSAITAQKLAGLDKRNMDAKNQAIAQYHAASGQTPFNDALRQRLALLKMIQGIG